ncbi:universal stress protein [Mycobacterium mantenii]|uniref:universal stress protein n=1 Tax=Mycobacterium mantenii TaxID=560555 RepID=UPI001F62594D|nr:universal stress protein [Mycobacterium mantenii]
MTRSENLAMNELRTDRPIAVGIDGSKAAVQAALWAVDEAVTRDAPLRLVYAIERGDGDAEPEVIARAFAAAETAIERALTAIESTGQQVKTETEIVQGPAIRSLIAVSASAAMVCVGAMGLRHFRAGRVGSTAAALAISAQCPVAIVRGLHDQTGQLGGRIVVEVGNPPDCVELLGVAMEEARTRSATVQAIICRRTVSYGTAAEDKDDRRAIADLDRRLSGWRRRHPEIRVESAAVHNTLFEYLACNRGSVQLAIVGSDNREHLKELVGPVGSAVLQDGDCSLLVVKGRHL